MLQLKNIVKNYRVGDTEVQALKGISLAFRESEFVSILGPSGCGKTTLLNIIGGLDIYTSGDLMINGRSTKEYKNADWDTYRNHSVGFVFQSYNLIPHQTVLSNVELALTLSGVSKTERRRRAKEALEKVGLGSQIHKKPNQMSGGQMQRVAIARALVNDPDILLADEPTGALDTATSLQIMELLKEISKNRLIIMVTHNPELAEQYSTRIVRLLDGQVTDDSSPYTEEQIKEDQAKQKKEQAKGKKSMSFFTALSLSFNNLMTKRARTLLTSFAGSIGIIGIALILALSTGVQAYIDSVQRDTLSSYPISIQAEEDMFASMFSAMGEQMEKETEKEPHEDGMVYSNPQMYEMFNAVFTDKEETNNLTDFKKFLDEQMEEETSTTGLYEHASTIQYQYDTDINCYVKNIEGKYLPCDLSKGFEMAGEEEKGDANNTMYSMLSANLSTLNLWQEMMPGRDGALISDAVYQQYDLLYGNWPKKANEIVLMVNKDNEISDLTFYSLGLMTEEEMNNLVSSALKGTEIPVTDRKLSYEDICKISFKLVLNCEYYADKDGKGVYSYIGDDDALMDMVIKNAYDLNIVGIIRVKEDAAGSPMSAPFGYTSALTEHIIDATNQSDVVKAQKDAKNENIDVLTGLPFVRTDETDPTDAEKAKAIKEYFSSLTDREKTELYTEILSTPTEETIKKAQEEYLKEYDTREKMEQLAAMAYGMDAETIKSYLSAYTDEELKEMMREQIQKIVEAQYAAQANEQVEAIKNTPSDKELAELVGRITAQLTSPQAKIGFVMADWKESTTMDEQTIAGYLAMLPPEELDKAVEEAAVRSAKEMYAGMAGTDIDAQYAKVAAVFDKTYTNETKQETLAAYYDAYMPSTTSESTLSGNLELLGVLDLGSPSAINIYSPSFEDKDAVSNIIAGYNQTAAEEDQINYTDYVAMLMSGVTDIINAISYGLIAFVSISLVVSSIMIGIITYISVLERTKEIGILRSIGASKHDVSLVFNAETLIVGLTAGLIGVGVSLLLCIPINLIIHALTGILSINAHLTLIPCVALVVISMLLTLIAGLIPSGIAARKDPVEALRTE